MSYSSVYIKTPSRRTVTRVKAFTATYSHALECSINSWLEAQLEDEGAYFRLLDIRITHTEHGALSALAIYTVMEDEEVPEDE